MTDDAPDRRQGGTGIRQSHLLEAVARRHACHLFSTGGPADPGVAALLAGTHELPKKPTWWPSTRAQRRLHDLWLAGPGGPRDIYLTAQARASLAAALQGADPFDLVVVEHFGLAPLVAQRSAGKAWALTLHYVASSRAGQELSVSAGGVRKQLVRRERSLAMRLEARALREFDVVCCVSELDASQLPGRADVVENGVDLEAFRPTPVPTAPTVVFTGTLSYAPNVDGLRWFVEQSWPLVRARVPAARVQLVGRLPSPAVMALEQHDGVSVHPDVPDIRPYVEQARAAVIPLRIGSGTRLKALEAMAAGRPVVGTGIGLEGLRVQAGVEVLLANDPAGLADQLVAVLTDDALAERLARAGRSYVEAHHGWQAIGRRYVDLLEGVAAGRP